MVSPIQKTEQGGFRKAMLRQLLQDELGHSRFLSALWAHAQDVFSQNSLPPPFDFLDREIFEANQLNQSNLSERGNKWLKPKMRM
jgi:hypothetical protein